MSLIGKKPANTYKDLLYVDNTNSGVDATNRVVKSGEGSSSAIKVGSDSVSITPVSTDSTTAFTVTDKDSNSILTVDTTNDIVKVGVNQLITNTQYAYFGMDASGTAGFAVDNHYALNFATGYNASSLGHNLILGTGTNPDTSFTISINGMVVANTVWYLLDNIVIDAVSFWVGADGSGGDTVRCHLMSYDIITTAGATSGDLSNGVVIADGADIVSAGYEQSYYQSMTIQSASVNAGRALFFTFKQDGINSDYSISATIKYHLV